MGTRGLKVYRHKGRYFVYYNRWDSYPSGLGRNILCEIPRGDRGVLKDIFDAWVWLIRKALDAQYEKVKNNSETNREYVTDEQPKTHLFIEWIYKIDWTISSSTSTLSPYFVWTICRPTMCSLNMGILDGFEPLEAARVRSSVAAYHHI